MLCTKAKSKGTGANLQTQINTLLFLSVVTFPSPVPHYARSMKIKLSLTKGLWKMIYMLQNSLSCEWTAFGELLYVTQG